MGLNVTALVLFVPAGSIGTIIAGILLDNFCDISAR